MRDNTIEIILIVVVIVLYIATAVVLLKREMKELIKLPIEKLKKRMRSDVYFVIFLLIMGGITFVSLFQYISSNPLQIVNAFLWGLLMIYFWLLDIFIIKRCIKIRQKGQTESE